MVKAVMGVVRLDWTEILAGSGLPESPGRPEAVAESVASAKAKVDAALQALRNKIDAGKTGRKGKKVEN